ncbi:MFS transporter [Sphingomonas sp. YL-JM2C]
MDQTFRDRLPALMLICMTQFMIPFDYMSITLSITSIRSDLGMSPSMTPWIMSSYLLTFGGLLLLGGKLADLYGRRRMLIIGLLIFGSFSIATAFSTSPGFFLAARACKGVGSAMICPAMLAILNTAFPEARERHRALAVYWFCSVAGGAIGTGLGGFLSDISWRLTLFVNVPLALTLVTLAPRLLSESRSPFADRQLDYGGAFLSMVGIGAAIFSITNAMRFGLTAVTIASIALSTVCLFALYRLERVHPSPLMPPRLFTIRNVIGANVFTFFWGAANSKFLVARFLEEVQHYSAGEAGTALLPYSLVSLFAAAVAVRLLDRFGAIRTMLIGSGMEGIGIIALCMVGPGTLYVVILASTVATALGFAVAGIASKLPACWEADDRDQGIASGMVFAMQQLANAFAIPIYLAVLDVGATWSAASPEEALANGYRVAFAVALFFIVTAGIVATIFLRDRRQAPDAADLPGEGQPALAVER